VTSPARRPGRRFSPLRLDLWTLGVFAGAFTLMAGVGLRLIVSLHVTGDEPWYLLQSYSLLHRHTPDLSAALRDQRLHAQLLGTTRDDHTRDYLGNGQRLLFYLPGYAAAIAPMYALGGRALVVLVQALAAALTAALLYAEARRTFGSRPVALFACLAYLATLPVLAYVGQLFPSTLAACATFIGYLLVTRWLPATDGWRLILLGAATGAVAFALPWLHFRYALTALVVAGAALLILRPRLSRPPVAAELVAASTSLVGRDPPPSGGSGSLQGGGRRTPLGAAAADVPASPLRALRERAAGASRPAWYAAVLVAGLTALTFLSITLYSHHYFGTWTPPNAEQQLDLLRPQLGQVVALYRDMFFGQQSGLIPWVPLDLLVVPGLALLWRRHPLQGRTLAALLVAQLGMFLSAAVSPVSQGTALPARFTLECAPLFALCTAAVFAAGAPSLRSWRAAIRTRAVRAARQEARGLPPRLNLGTRATERPTKGPALRTTAAAVSLILLAATSWFALVGQIDPARLYPGPSGPRLAEEYPNALPAAWFAMFPSRPTEWVTRGVVALGPAQPAGGPVQDAGGHSGVLGLPTRILAAALLARSQPMLMPPGHYIATFTVGCDPTSAPATALRLVVERRAGRRTAHPVATTECAGIGHALQIAVPFTSDGYHAVVFAVMFGGTTSVVAWSVAYAPAFSA
jgi:hypothetical protein